MSENVALVKCYRENRTSKQGKPYQVLVIQFANGYKTDLFLSNEQQYILSKEVPCVN